MIIGSVVSRWKYSWVLLIFVLLFLFTFFRTKEMRDDYLKEVKKDPIATVFYLIIG